MMEIWSEFGHATTTPFGVLAARLVLAAACGAAIGFEREWRNRPAGLRTHILVCLAAAVFAVLALEMVNQPMLDEEGVHLDPIRIVEAVTSGVAFLAAGVVIVARGEIHGLTTGAGLWLSGAIGVAAGLGLWQIALFATLLALLVLGLLHALTRRMELGQSDD
ncbi:MAG: MgtC/SapB family protein [Rhizobiaceae bacterium]|nr:MAG: MgtC/SapB family protein [Rhizobiaceae bacterium]